MLVQVHAYGWPPLCGALPAALALALGLSTSQNSVSRALDGRGWGKLLGKVVAWLSQGRMRVGQASVVGKGISGRGNSKCKEPEMGANLAWLSKSEKTSRAGAVSRWREKAMTSER